MQTWYQSQTVLVFTPTCCTRVCVARAARPYDAPRRQPARPARLFFQPSTREFLGIPIGFLLVFGFALARANARMLLNADAKRRSSKNAVRTSRPRSVATA